MAIYHFSAQIIGRSKGRSATAAATYRSGEKIRDERTGKTYDYTGRRGVEYKEILAPDHAPEWVYHREQLWNEVEKAEKRKDSQLCREINVALPRELSRNQQQELIKGFVQEQFVDRGMVADIAIHRNDPENPHAHVMLTMREITNEGFSRYRNTEWNQKELLEQWREEWANHANRELERHRCPDRITHLSHEARGLETLPQKHLGHQAHAMEERGIRTDRGDYNRMVKEHNETVKEMKAVVRDLQEYREEKTQREQEREQWKHYAPPEKAAVKQATILMKTYVDLPKIEERLRSIDAWEKKVTKNEIDLHVQEQTLESARKHVDQIDQHQQAIERSREQLEQMNWLNPLKWSKNRAIKERALQDIASAQKHLAYHEKEFKSYKEKLGTPTKEEFVTKYHDFQEERTRQRDQNRMHRDQINEQRNILNQAKEAMQKAEIRRVAAQYPDWKEVGHMTYQTAMKLDQLNQQQGRVVPIDTIQKEYETYRTKEKELHQKLSSFDSNKSRLQLAKSYLEGYEKAVAEVKRLEKSGNKLHRFFSKNADKTYTQAVEKMNACKYLMKKYGVEDRPDLERQMNQQTQAERVQKPAWGRELSGLQAGLSILSEFIQGMEQANRAYQQEQQRQRQHRGRSRGIERGR